MSEVLKVSPSEGSEIDQEIGGQLTPDARYLLRLAIHLGIARRTETSGSAETLASWSDLAGAALIAHDPASRWLQEKKNDFDPILTPSPRVQKTAKLAADTADSFSNVNPKQLPLFSSSIRTQLEKAASSVKNFGPTAAVHIVASLVLASAPGHEQQLANDEEKHTFLRTHMMQWVFDSAGLFAPSWLAPLSKHLAQPYSDMTLLRPELSSVIFVNTSSSFSGAWPAHGLLGAVLLFGRSLQPDPEWAPLIEMLEQAAGSEWSADLPPEDEGSFGTGRTQMVRAAALAAKLGSSFIDLRHLIGAAFAHPDAKLPPAVMSFPVFGVHPAEADRQGFRRRFLAIIAAANTGENLNVWADFILGERLVTARIPTDREPATDLLGFTRFANAFASVIADNNVKPPLAIGLFGAWGSGKSAMIEMIIAALRDIDSRARLDATRRFCRGILSIKFNAWHYAETNLWASLFVRILEEMSAHLKPASAPAMLGARDSSLLALQAAKQCEQDAAAALAEAELKAAQATEAAVGSEQELAKARQAGAALAAAHEAAKAAALAAQESRFRALDLAGDAAALLFAFGRPTPTQLGGAAGGELAGTLEQQRKDLSDLVDSFKDVKGPVHRLQAILGWSKPTQIYLLLAALLAIPVGLFIYFAAKAHWLEAMAGGALSFFAVVSSALVVIAPLWNRARQTLSQAPALLNKLADAAEDVKARKTQRDEAVAAEQAARLTPALAEAGAETKTAGAKAEETARQAALANSAVATARAKMEAARQAVAAAETQIAETAPERLLSRFVADRAGSEEYGRLLGLPTRIRRDLEKLTEYLNDLAATQGATKYADRIVLFIDDLDRCGPGVVVKVLEAVQILLAYERFIVVVGVDVRWLTQSLSTHHAQQFDEAILEPEDFLEKIFQVPFWIPPMTKGGSEAVISDALPELQAQVQPGAVTGAASPPPGAVQSGEGIGQNDSNGGAGAAPLPTLEPVDLTAEEHAALLRWGRFAGETPRRLKRFARSYLILRASMGAADRDAFLESGAFDTVARLLALNTGNPHLWANFTSFVKRKNPNWETADQGWPLDSFGAAHRELFAENTNRPSREECRLWLTEVERFGFASWDAAIQNVV